MHRIKGNDITDVKEKRWGWKHFLCPTGGSYMISILSYVILGKNRVSLLTTLTKSYANRKGKLSTSVCNEAV